jgi:hypothetical protein
VKNVIDKPSEEYLKSLAADLRAAESRGGDATQAPAMPATGMLMRERSWGELNIEVKIERMRSVVKALRDEVEILRQVQDQMRTQFQLLTRELTQHRHAVDDGGRVMLPADAKHMIEALNQVPRGYQVGEAHGPERDSDQVYF